MAKYLKPKRGSQHNAIEQDITLEKGELFLEFPEGKLGTEPGRLIIGKGDVPYSQIKYQPGNTTSFQPFITDPSIYVPRFSSISPQASSYTFDAGIEEINAIGNGSTAGEKLPNIIGHIKDALCKHANSLNKLNNNLTKDGFNIVSSDNYEKSFNLPGNSTFEFNGPQTATGFKKNAYINPAVVTLSNNTTSTSASTLSGEIIIQSLASTADFGAADAASTNVYVKVSSRQISASHHAEGSVIIIYPNDIKRTAGTAGGWANTTEYSLNDFLTQLNSRLTTLENR